MSPDSTHTEQTLPAGAESDGRVAAEDLPAPLSLIHISEPTRPY